MHLPFAYELMRELKPQTFVELGVYRGESYFAFCQSVEENRLETQCFGIDTWRGDIHSGVYGPEIGREVAEHNVRYARFSRLLQMTFDEALEHFAPASIDLLHIDGAHRYEDVKHDFEAWRSKLSRRAIVLFHDATERSGDFGVFRLWHEIAKPRRSFLFDFGHGLGVWKRAALSEADPVFLKRLFGARKEEATRIHAEYALKAAALRLIAEQNGELARTRDAPTARVFAPHRAIVEEMYTSAARLNISQWQRLSIDLPWGVGDGSQGIRFDPVDRAGVVEVAGVMLRSSANGEVRWSARKPADLQQLTIAGTCVRVPDRRTLRLLCYSDDPQIRLPLLDARAFAEPFVFQAWIRFDPAYTAMQAAAKELSDASRALEVANSRLAVLERENDRNGSEQRSAKLVVYAAGPRGYDEQAKLELGYRLDCWAHLHIALEHGLGCQELRVDPIDCPGLIDIAGVAINSAVTGGRLWQAHDGNEQMAQVRICGSAVRVPHPRLVRVLSYGNDAQLLLPALSAPEFSGPLRLELWLRSRINESAIGEAVRSLADSASAHSFAESQLALAAEDRAGEAEASAQSEILRAEVNKLADERKKLDNEVVTLRKGKAQSQRKVDQMRSEIAAVAEQRDAALSKLEAARQKSEEYRRTIDEFEGETIKLREKLVSADDTMNKQRSESERAQAECMTLQRQLDIASAELVTAAHELTTTRSEIAHVRQQLEEHRKRLAPAEYEWWPSFVRSVRRWAGSVHEDEATETVTLVEPPHTHWIDQPRAPSNADEEVVISGWVIHPDGDLIQRIRSRIGELMFVGIYGYERLDVGASFPTRPDAKYSGFEIRAALPPGCHRLNLQHASANSEWQTFATFDHEVLDARTGSLEEVRNHA